MPNFRTVAEGFHVASGTHGLATPMRVVSIRLVRPLRATDLDENGHIMRTPEATVTHSMYDADCYHESPRIAFPVTALAASTKNMRFEWKVACHSANAECEGHVNVVLPFVASRDAVVAMNYYANDVSAFKNTTEANAVAGVDRDDVCVRACQIPPMCTVLLRNFSVTADSVGLLRAITSPEYRILARAIEADPVVSSRVAVSLFQVICRIAPSITVCGLKKDTNLNGRRVSVAMAGHTSTRLAILAGNTSVKIRYENLRVSFHRVESETTAAARNNEFGAAKAHALDRLQQRIAWDVQRTEMSRLQISISAAEDKIEELESRLSHTTDDACAVCLEKRRIVAIVHASEELASAPRPMSDAHLCMCEECAASFCGTACPLCRKPIVGFVKVYNRAGPLLAGHVAGAVANV
jgi:hypothetical protein